MRVELLAGKPAGGHDLMSRGAKIGDSPCDDGGGDALAPVLRGRAGMRDGDDAGAPFGIGHLRF